MVLFDEDPVTLIKQTTNNFHTTSDLSCLDRINSSLSTLRSARSLRLQSQSQSLAHLARAAHHQQNEHDAHQARHDPAAHAQRILALDTQKFRLAKTASDLEIEGERLESELRSLRATLRRLEDQGDEGDDNAPEKSAEDEAVLKLRIYRALGIEADRDADTGAVTRAVVRNAARGDVSVIAVDPAFDRFFYANHFWSCL